jgi:hypothetical protein
MGRSGLVTPILAGCVVSGSLLSGCAARSAVVDAKRRVVTVYDATGDTAKTRIVYTRRQP